MLRHTKALNQEIIITMHMEQNNNVDLQVVVSYSTRKNSDIHQCVQLLDLLPVIDLPEASAFQLFWSM